MKVPFNDSSKVTEDWISVNENKGTIALATRKINDSSMPQLNGLGLKDVVYLCETKGLKIIVKGKGKVVDQSIAAGQPIAKGQIINVALN